MRGPFDDRLIAVLRRVRRIERRELRAVRRWIERTSTLVHLSVLVFVPLLVALVTALSNSVGFLSFLLFPPLAAGTYTLFAHPEGRYASPSRFVTGLTLGALCGWAAVAAATALGIANGSGTLSVGAVEAATAVFLAGTVTWALDVEEPAAYSTALLALLVPRGQEGLFVLSVLLASSIVALVFSVWRERFYERRARFLYESTSGDDHVLVPMRGENPGPTAMLGARLAAAHDAGKVVLLDVVDSEAAARAERALLDEGRRVHATDGGTDRLGDAESSDATDGTDGEATDPAVAAAVTRLEERASEIERDAGVPCQVVVAVGGGSVAATVLGAARETGCDLVAAAYETDGDALSPYLYDLFAGDVDVLVHRSGDGRTRWSRALVPVRRASDVAHSMLDFAARLVGDGHVSVATCVSGERGRRRGEAMLADLVEAFDEGFETRVSTLSIERFLAENDDRYDIVFMGASTDRSAASRLISPPTFERIREVDSDVAIVDRS